MLEEKQVKFDRGKVSTYNGQTDLYCDFVTVSTKDKQDIYYLLNGKKLGNGLFIASTILKEAIDPNIPKTSLGIINSKGDICIPFENKIIKEIDDKYLLVVRNKAKTKSVIDAISSRNDPTAAERMVNANATIKDKLNRRMNNQGRFILNDLLSEGSIYSVDGHNLMDDKYVSFIGMTDDSFYCSTNIASDDVVEIPRNIAFTIPNSAPIVVPDETIEEKGDFMKEDKLDVSQVEVPKETIDTALPFAKSDSSSKQSMQEEKKDSIDVFSLKNSEIPKPVIPVSQNNVFSPLTEVTPDSISDVLPNVSETKVNNNIQEDNFVAPFDSSKTILEDDIDDQEVYSDDIDKELGMNLISGVAALVKSNKQKEEELLSFRRKQQEWESNGDRILQLNDRIQQLEQQNAQKDEKIHQLQQEKDYISLQYSELIKGLRGALSGSAQDKENQVFQKVA